MADIAQDASGPTSSEPAGTTQQVKQPASSDRGKLRVFISYSRDDLKFADQLDDAVNACGFECLIDRHDISGGEDWKRRLGNLIREADTVVFVLSPSSARSPICDWEVEEAARLNKRVLPVNCRPLEGVSPPPRLRERNYIFFYEEPKVSGSGFGNGLANLVTALNTDFDWLREHTRYLQRAIEWDTGGRPANRLLSGDDIRSAKDWAAARPKTAPEPTALQLDFIRASEEEAEARLSEQRKQLEAMAAAQAEREKALHAAEEAQRKQATMAKVRNIALVAVSIFAVLAALLGWRAEQQRRVAEEQRAVAEGERSVGHLRTLPIREAVARGRYAEALQLQEALASAEEAVETKREGKPGEETARSLSEVAWRALFAREFPKALAVANRAHALLPENLWSETDRAYALMFLGQKEEAKALYLAHKGEPVSQADKKLWEQAIAEDFAEFRKAGLTSPMMADIENELGISR
jgi:hypothetical protein